MPRGVTDHFLRILKNERKQSLRALVVAVALCGPLYFMAELTDEPLYGRIVIIAGAALALGIVAGVLLGRFQTHRYNESLKTGWNAWMRMSLSATRIREVARGVSQKPASARSASAIGWAFLVVLNAVLFLVLWNEASFASSFGLFTTILNGLVVGALAGHAAWCWHWTGQFGRALDELMADGSVGLWGEV